MKNTDSTSSRPDISKGLFLDMFKARDDVYATQMDNGIYLPIHKGVDMDVLNRHLDGEETVGQYAVRPSDDTVRFAAIDNDIDDDSDAPLSNALDAAIEERENLFEMGFNEHSCIIEFSGRRGYHLWVFFEPRIDATRAKVLMEKITDGVEIEGGHHEVFPKQVSVPEGSYGNLIKMPLGIHQETGNRMLFVDDSGKPLEDQRKALRPISRNMISPEDVDVAIPEEDIDYEKEKRKSLQKSNEEIEDNQDIRPCIMHAVSGKVDELKGDEGHKMRLAAATELLANGYSIEETVQMFSHFSNFDRDITTRKVKEIDSKGHHPWRCQTLKDKCPKYCSDCPCPYLGATQSAVEAMEMNNRRFSESWDEK